MNLANDLRDDNGFYGELFIGDCGGSQTGTALLDAPSVPGRHDTALDGLPSPAERFHRAAGAAINACLGFGDSFLANAFLELSRQTSGE